MMKHAAVFFVTILVLTTFGCAPVHTSVIGDPQSFSFNNIRAITLAPIEIISGEQDAEALASNEDLRKAMEKEMHLLFTNKKIEEKANAPAVVNCSIDVVYGHRAKLFYFGHGIGTGRVIVTIKLRNANGEWLFSVKSTAEMQRLTIKNMREITLKAIQECVEEFSLCL